METATKPTIEETRLLKRGQIKALIDITKLTGPPFDRILIRNNHLYLGGRYVIVELDLQELNITDEIVDPPTFTPGSIHMDELKRWYGLEHGYLTVEDLEAFTREDKTEPEVSETLKSIDRVLNMNLAFEPKLVDDFAVAAWQLKLILRLLPNAATLITTFRGDGSAMYRIVYGPWVVVGVGIRIQNDKEKENAEVSDDEL